MSFDEAAKQEINHMCKQLTHTGKCELDKMLLTKFEALCLKSDAHVKHSFQLLVQQLKEKHSEIRYGTLLVCDELFRKSCCFRECMIGELALFMQNTIGTEDNHPLPPPKRAAYIMRERALRIISDWYHSYKVWYSELQSAYEFLRDCVDVDFESVERKMAIEEAKRVEAKERAIVRKNELMLHTLKDCHEHLDEISSAAAILRNCIDLLLPPPEEFCIPQVQEDNASAPASISNVDKDLELREYGILDQTHSIPLTVPTEMPKVELTDDNQAIIESARDAHRQISKKYLPQLKSWNKVLLDTKCVAEQFTVAQLLQDLGQSIAKCKQIGLEKYFQCDAGSSEDESDFEDVAAKEGYEQNVGDALLAQLIMERECMAYELEKKAAAPIDYGGFCLDPRAQPDPAEHVSMHIEDWEKRSLEIPHCTLRCEPLDTNQVWLSASVSQSDEPFIPKLDSIPIEFSSAAEPIKWACRVPLPSGRLCPRRDRIKCPFHGVIVPRDEQGRCTRLEDARAEAARVELHNQQNPDWQDPKWLAELERTTGFDLKMPIKGKKKTKAPEFPGLTDLKKKHDSPRQRLAKKLFKKK